MRVVPNKVTESMDRIPAKWQFVVFLGATLVITIALTILAYSLYLISGTAQLDLSRPGYKQALSEVSPSDNDNYDFSATGALDRKALDEFKNKYDTLIGKTKGYSAFDPGALSDEQLNLNDTTVIGPQ